MDFASHRYFHSVLFAVVFPEHIINFPWHRHCIFFRQSGISDTVVGEPWKILVADRNRHVRDLLRRELEAEGYAVETAKDGREVRLRVNEDTPPDLIILDLEIPYLEDLVELEQFRKGELSLPMIIFSFLPEDDRPVPKAAAFLEKKEDVQRLKELVAEVIERYYPDKTAGYGPA